jgi:hypothetical protein
MRYEIEFPDSMPVDTIRDALLYIGGKIAPAQTPRTVARARKASSGPAREYRALFYKRRVAAGDQVQHLRDAGETVLEDETGPYIPCEMDGVTVDKAIRAQEARRLAAQRHDGRDKRHFPNAYDASQMTTLEYVRKMEDCWNLKH